MQRRPTISLIAALSAFNRGIGNNGALLWSLPEDLKHFQRLTRNHPVVMGRKTFDSIVGYIGSPLPNRTNIVITRRPAHISYSGVYATASLSDALEYACTLETDEVFVAGGAHVYEQALPYADRLYLTLVADTPQADTFFPAYEDTFPTVIERHDHEEHGIPYTWLTLERAK
jgi:dihydrofolate reductase